MIFVLLKIFREQFPFLHSLVSFCIMFKRRPLDCLSPLSLSTVIPTLMTKVMMIMVRMMTSSCFGEVGDNYIKKGGIGRRSRREVTFVRFMLITPLD